ncbi:hypothetical protein [Streptomyces reniochalinae]
MTLTFRDIMTADASALDDAAAAFRRMGKRFGELHTDYNTRVSGQVARSSWAGVARVSYDEVARVSSGQFGAAKHQAQNIATLLTKAYDDLADRKRTLGRRVKAAEEDKMSVDGDGRVTLDTTKLNEGERVARGHDHTYAEALDEQTAKWQSSIDAALEAVNEADVAIKRALIAAVEPPQGPRGRSTRMQSRQSRIHAPGTRQDLDRILRELPGRPRPGRPGRIPPQLDLARRRRASGHERECHGAGSGHARRAGPRRPEGLQGRAGQGVRHRR